MDYSPCSEKEIWPFLKGSHISETRETTPTKIGVHALDINPYLHKFFEPILMDYFFDVCPKRKFGRFGKVAISPKPERPRLPKRM